MSPSTSPYNPSFDSTRKSSDSMRRPVVVVHRYADGHERVYRYTPPDGDGYEAEHEQEELAAGPLAPPMVSRWSLGSSVVESAKTTKQAKYDTDSAKKEKDKDKEKDKEKEKEKEKTGKKKRLVSFMSRLSLAPTHPYQPVVMVPGRWDDIDFVAPSPSRSRARALPLSVRAEMMREKERQREREKERLKDRVDRGSENSVPSDPQPARDHPQLVGEELNQDQDLGYAPSSMSLPSSPSHVVQTFAFSAESTRMRSRTRSTPLPFVDGSSGELFSEPELTIHTQMHNQKARADSLSPFVSYTDIHSDTNMSDTDNANGDSPLYRLSFSTPTLPLLTKAPSTTSIAPTTERPLPPTPTSPVSSFQDYDLSTTSSGSNSTLGLVVTKKSTRRTLGIRGLAARMMRVPQQATGDSLSPSRPQQSQLQRLQSAPYVFEHKYFERDEREVTPFPLYSASGKKEEEKERWGIQKPLVSQKGGGKGGKEKRKLVISGIQDSVGHVEEAVRRWCEAFGEVRAFEKRGKGCLVVDFRKASVADTVSGFFFLIFNFINLGGLMIMLCVVGVSRAGASLYSRCGECEFELDYKDDEEGWRGGVVIIPLLVFFLFGSPNLPTPTPKKSSFVKAFPNIRTTIHGHALYTIPPASTHHIFIPHPTTVRLLSHRSPFSFVLLVLLVLYISTPHPPKVYMETPPPSLNPLPRFPAAPRLLDIITSSAQPPPPTSRPHHAIYFATTPQPQPLQPPT